MKNKMLRYGLTFSAAASLLSAGSAFAVIDPAISGAVTTAQTDGVLLAGMITTAILMLFAAKFLRRAA